PLTKLPTTVGQWRAESGHCEITRHTARTGSQALRIFGGRERTVEFVPPGDKADLRILSFWAERWTGRDPFRFRIDSLSKGQWRTLYCGDKTIRVGDFHVRVEVDLGDKPADKYRLVCSSPAGSGILIDDLQLVPASPIRVASVTVLQETTPVLVGNACNPVLNVRIKIEGNIGSLSLSEMQITTKGSDDLNDIESIQVISTGARETADWRNAETWTPKSATLGGAQKPASNLTFRGSIPLVSGINSLWVSVKLKPGANINSFVTAACKAVVVTGKAGARTHSPQIDHTPVRQRLGLAVRKGGDDGVRAFRIPGLVTTNKGTLIGVYDIRYGGWGDLPGNIDVGMSRSTDGGKTWEKMKVIMDMGSDRKWRYDGIGDPSIAVDTVTNTIWVAATWSHGNRSWHGSGPGLTPEETGQFMLVKSTDDGKTWSKPINITKQVKDPKWCFVLAGPGRGIMTADGTIVIPAQYQDTPKNKRLPRSTFIYSRDRGKSWKIAAGALDHTTESAIAEISPGVLMLNCRYNRASKRVVMTTKDLGKTWTEHPTSRKTLVEPGACMASLITCPSPLGAGKPPLLIFSNPNVSSGRRRRMTIKLSTDSGLTWPEKHHLLLDAKPGAGYSCLTMIDKKTIGILYEGGTAHMVFQRIPLSDLMKGAEQ
ncbi:MAG: exo-alpha-sialidase, partial [Phycisphaerae bacterium]|nr:exo-alpha-sialidase [Phycisphaerae bacterium]